MVHSTQSSYSRLGIASFVLSLMPIVAMIITVTTIYSYMGDNLVEDALEEAILPMMMAGLLMLGSLLLSLIFGLITVFQKEKKRTFGVAGLCITFGWILFFIISTLIEEAAAY